MTDKMAERAARSIKKHGISRAGCNDKMIEIIAKEYAPILAAADAMALTLGEIAHDTYIAQPTIDRARVELEAYRKARL